jgi:chromosome segregation ATPase
LVLLKAELGTVSADKNDLTSRLVDVQTKLRQLERSENEARETASTSQATLSAKEREIARLRLDLGVLDNIKSQLEDSLRSIKQTLSKTESERDEIQRREQTARQESIKSKRDADLYREKIASLESLRVSFTNERNALTEELQIKTAQLESSQTLMQSLREQSTEMGHRAREAKERCEGLDEELSEAHKLLGERAREAGTMRRLLDEAEGREAGRIKEAREKLDVAVEERDQLEEEIALLRRNNAEGSGELTKSLREKEHEVKELTTKYEIARRDVDALTKQNADVQARLLETRKEAEEATLKLSKLSKSLVVLVRHH